MIPDFKTYIGESLWSDLQNKSIGKSIRKEDDVNSMDMDRFVAYLNQHYVLKTPDDLKIQIEKYPGVYNSVKFPIITDISDYKRISEYDYDICSIKYTPDDELKGIHICFINASTECKKNIILVLDEKYYLKRIFVGNGDRIEYAIYPDDKCKCTHSFILEVIDFVSDNVQGDAKKTMFKK